MGRKATSFIANQFVDKRLVSKYKVTDLADADIKQVEGEWLNRIITLDSKAGRLLSSDSRLNKASVLLASAAMSDKYKIRVVSKAGTPVEDSLTILKYVSKQEKLANDLVAVMQEGRMTVPVMEQFINSVASKKTKTILVDMKETLRSELKYKYLVEDLARRIDIERIMFNGCLNSVLLGDDFFEVVYDSSNILSIEPLSLSKVFPMLSKKGIVERWFYYDKQYINPIALYPYQVLHFTFLPGVYIGTGLFTSTMNVSAITRQIENYMMLSRKTRSVQTRFHFPNFSNLPESMKEQVGMPSEEDIESYRQKIMTALRNNAGASLDIVSNGYWDVKNVASDGATFSSIDDTEYFNELFKIGLLVPTGLIDSGSNVNRATMDLQIKFLKGLFNIMKQERKNNTAQLVNMELILNNIDPSSYYIEVINDNSGLTDILEASQIAARINNKYNNFPMPVLANLLGIDWKDIVDGYNLQSAAGISNDPKS